MQYDAEQFLTTYFFFFKVKAATLRGWDLIKKWDSTRSNERRGRKRKLRLNYTFIDPVSVCPQSLRTRTIRGRHLCAGALTAAPPGATFQVRQRGPRGTTAPRWPATLTCDCGCRSFKTREAASGHRTALAAAVTAAKTKCVPRCPQKTNTNHSPN